MSTTPFETGPRVEPEPPTLPVDLPPPDDYESWNKAAQDFQEKRLESVQSSAETWNAALLSLIGLFGTVSILVGAEKIQDVSTEWVRWVAIVLIAAAGLCAGISIWRGTQAQTTPDVSSNSWNGEVYRAWVMTKSQSASNDLRSARTYGATTAILIFVTGILLLIEGAVQ
jgi:hypothetical protein